MDSIDIITASTAIASALAAGGSLVAAQRSLKTANRAALTAEAAARTAESVAQIERDRWHSELQPVLNIRIDDRAVMTVRYTGPVALGPITAVELTIRNDSENHQYTGLAGSPTREQLDAVLWSPLRFSPGIDDTPEDGRTAHTFSLDLGEARKVAMTGTVHPHWYVGGFHGWNQRWVNKPVRLWVVCHVDGHRPWRTSMDVLPDQDVFDTIG